MRFRIQGKQQISTSLKKNGATPAGISIAFVRSLTLDFDGFDDSWGSETETVSRAAHPRHSRAARGEMQCEDISNAVANAYQLFAEGPEVRIWSFGGRI